MDNERKNSNYVDIFVWGLTGAGKDTVADFLKSYYNMRKIRIAGTIKQIICEQLNVSFEELEAIKRSDPAIRDKHHEVSAWLGNQISSLNRTYQIAQHNSFDLQLCEDPEKALVVCDVRTIEEATILLDNDFVGIFLERLTDEYRRAGHFTENNMFTNGQLVELANTLDYGERFVVVFNDSKTTPDERKKLIELLPDEVTFVYPPNDCNAQELLEAIDKELDKFLS